MVLKSNLIQLIHELPIANYGQKSGSLFKKVSEIAVVGRELFTNGYRMVGEKGEHQKKNYERTKCRTS